ncbi:MAG: hypothetical protein GDA49_09450 [Rhodospirillales bacterium]|nr:hypothetical protein [Rhodospirillales bacterium]
MIDDTLTALITGGATGLLGTFVSAATDYFQARQRHRQEIRVRRHDLELHRARAALAERGATIEAQLARMQDNLKDENDRMRDELRAEIVRIQDELKAENARMQDELAALKASHEEPGLRWSRPGDGPAMVPSMVFVNVIRGLLRPLLTVAFLGLTAIVYFTLDGGYVTNITPPGGGTTEINIHSRVIDTILYLTTTTVLWWFGARQIGKRTDREADR